MYLSPEEQEDDGHFRVLLHCIIGEKQFIELFPGFVNCSIKWMKSMKMSSSYIATYEHLVFQSDPSMTVTVLLFSVWLHNVQVPIRCFFGRRKETSFSIS